MRIIQAKPKAASRYATLHRPHYICPECRVPIIRDRQEDMFLCLQCGRKETRSEFRETLISNAARERAETLKARKDMAAKERVRRHLETKDGKDALSVVYYIQFQNLIKIGKSSDLRNRMVGLPWDSILLTEPGSYKKEHERHEQFKHLNHQGEWFKAEPDLLDFIARRRKDLEEYNTKLYAGLPTFPWVRGSVEIPGQIVMERNAHEVLEFDDAIQVDELEYSGVAYSADPGDIV